MFNDRIKNIKGNFILSVKLKRLRTTQKILEWNPVYKHWKFVLYIKNYNKS